MLRLDPAALIGEARLVHMALGMSATMAYGYWNFALLMGLSSQIHSFGIKPFISTLGIPTPGVLKMPLITSLYAASLSHQFKMLGLSEAQTSLVIIALWQPT
jgi:hypothetical protein